MRQKKFILQEQEIPTHWYNIQADMPTKPLPPLNPATRKPLNADDLSHIFNKECAKQEMDMEHTWIEIPEEVREKYSYYRTTPLVRAYALENALGTTAHIYFKNESTNPLGSHKINSAIPQCYYCKQEGDTNVTTETGAGQWGMALSYAAKLYGLEAAVYQVKITMQQKPYRSTVMRTFGATVEGSPSMSTRAGKNVITRDPNYPGSLGTAISEAIELATTTPGCKYALGSVLNHVALHQTVIGLEAEKQMKLAGEYPDKVIACFGGGSNFGGIAFPFMRHLFDGSHKDTEFIAAEPESCPKLTRGKFEYDFGDEAGYTPLLPMYTLGHDFKPANIHAGGLRYHGAGVIISQLIKDGFMKGVDIPQLESFEAGLLFAQTEGIIPAPESCHAIAATIREANKATKAGQSPVILFCLSGHGLIDMPSYDSFINGDLRNYSVSDSEIEENLKNVPR
ncbi:TrpB-like pyridoxal phosphate-dependent enzyme [Segatella maculosa]|uniref:TrpB-like pyridoxal phosphate-dependent enzyme n=1 Tax=Segatella maculosa TaxID=439703 RepID=UPI0023F00837|nr:TrpB-like pyridoxal phosphate-dependent enzyme [Segatella maculosa]